MILGFMDATDAAVCKPRASGDDPGVLTEILDVKT